MQMHTESIRTVIRNDVSSMVVCEVSVRAESLNIDWFLFTCFVSLRCGMEAIPSYALPQIALLPNRCSHLI